MLSEQNKQKLSLLSILYVLSISKDLTNHIALFDRLFHFIRISKVYSNNTVDDIFVSKGMTVNLLSSDKKFKLLQFYELISEDLNLTNKGEALLKDSLNTDLNFQELVSLFEKHYDNEDSFTKSCASMNSPTSVHCFSCTSFDCENSNEKALSSLLFDEVKLIFSPFKSYSS